MRQILECTVSEVGSAEIGYYAVISYKTAMSWHDLNVYFSAADGRVKEITSIDEVAFGEWIDWDEEDIQKNSDRLIEAIENTERWVVLAQEERKGERP